MMAITTAEQEVELSPAYYMLIQEVLNLVVSQKTLFHVVLARQLNLSMQITRFTSLQLTS